jgi:hypothetical protein
MLEAVQLKNLTSSYLTFENVDIKIRGYMSVCVFSYVDVKLVIQPDQASLLVVLT